MRYEKPKMNFVATQAKEAVADICWAYATGHKGKSMYYDIPGKGYAEVAIYETTGGCDGAIFTIVAYHNGATSADEHYVLDAINMAGGNSAEPFKGSPFEKKPDPSWS
ncbi:MAG: hypothetical protein J6J45_08480 [Clostridia bacterium]|nr:hypothetical protein [Clostridia bacterium]